MANTYTQCYFHLFFSVKNRDALIKREWKDELERYVTGIVQNHGQKMLAIGTMPDHVHVLNGAFTHSHSQIDLVAKYILSQEEHHKKRPFREEYLEILEKNEVQFKDEYVFDFFNDINGWG
jgi:putative transposase